MRQYEMFNKKQFESLYMDLKGDAELKDILAVRLAEEGISGAEADRVIHGVIHNVAACETMKNALSEDAAATFEAFLQDSRKMNGYDRKVLLHQLYFGLKLYQDPELAKKRLNGASADALFRAYYAEQGENPAVTEEVLENRIRELVAGYRISPAAMRVFAWELQTGKNMLVTSEAMGEEGYRLKCLAAMDLYLRNQGRMTVEEATAAACSSVDLQAAADASSCGMLTDDVLKLVLRLAALGIALYGAFFFFDGILKTPLVNGTMDEMMNRYDLTGEVSKKMFGHMGEETLIREKAKLETVMKQFWNAFQSDRGLRIKKEQEWAFALWAAAGAVVGFSGKLADMAGCLSAKRQYVRNAAEARAAEALNAAANRAEAENKTADARKADVQRQEDARRQAYEQEQEEKNRQRMKVFG